MEEAVKIAGQQGGEVVVVSVGPKNAANTIRSAMAMGAHRGILVIADTQFLDSVTTSLALKAAIEQDGTPDLILTGRPSVDSEGMQTSQVIVGINTDGDAPIFGKCDYGIAGDLFEVVPVLTAVLKSWKA